MANWNIYDQVRDFLLDPTTAAITGTFKCALVTAGYTVDQNLHDFWDDASADEVSGTNYTAGGNAAASITVTLSGAGVVTFDASDPATWLSSGAGFTNARRAILYWDTGVSTTSRLLAYSDDFGTDRGNSTGDFSIAFDAAGIYTQAR
jgi:hypothetical protein